MNMHDYLSLCIFLSIFNHCTAGCTLQQCTTMKMETVNGQKQRQDKQCTKLFSPSQRRVKPLQGYKKQPLHMVCYIMCFIIIHIQIQSTLSNAFDCNNSNIYIINFPSVPYIYRLWNWVDEARLWGGVCWPCTICGEGETNPLSSPFERPLKEEVVHPHMSRFSRGAVRSQQTAHPNA